MLQSATFRKWHSKLRDERAKAAIARRLLRLAQVNPGDVSPVGEGISELRIHHGPGYRVYFQKRGELIMLLLCAGDRAHRIETSERRKRSPPNGVISMSEKFTEFDVSDLLTSERAIEAFLTEAMETGDAQHIASALGAVARVKGMTKIARETGLAREHLYRSLSENGNPTLETTLAVLKTFGFHLMPKHDAAV
ncbi:putative addiction module antidote protein/putative addiction module killer protein [Sinorhizobium meliloti]|jgi:probable addiction module antidote protein/putative addiction module killer protein|nr:putative addiction module antidote protein/putative addiction module killer protein [Sinorhizobium meliloti]